MNCRVCGGGLESLAIYENMPARAQHLPIEPDAGVTLVVCECRSCGLVQLANEPVPYWREVIRATGLSDAMKAFRSDQFGYLNLNGKTVVEIGSGKGEYLSMLNRAGAKAIGIEGLDGPWILGDADAFAMFSVLEHMPDPVEALRQASGMLKKGGIGIVEVPNFDMIRRERLFSEFTADHLFYFTADTLQRTLELGGFHVEEIIPIWHDYILSATVRKRSRTSLAGLHWQQAHVTNQLHEFVERHGDVAVWGAGHQAFAVLSMCGVKARYVVDSAPFKHGHLTPATHIPIDEPERLRRDPVQAVIVMAAAYSDEVAGILRRDHPGLPVAILRPNGLEIQ